VYPDAVSFPVSLGDEVSLTGYAQEYYDETEIVVDSGSSLSVTGKGSVSTTSLTAPPTDWEPYEGVLVAAEGIRIGESLSDYGEWDTDWDIVVDDFLYDYSAVMAPGPLSSLTGVVRWSWDLRKLCPPRAADIQE
jgi:hypothetical protein